MSTPIDKSASSAAFPRREFLGAVGVGSVLYGLRNAQAIRPKLPMRPVCVATWPFGAPACDAAWKTLATGKATVLDACVTGVSVTERDPKVTSVGRGGLPNAAGVVQLDACVMDGTTAGCGAVAALEGVVTAAAVARAVMQKTRHILLVGPGARDFALKSGFKAEALLTPEAQTRWEAWKKKSPRSPGPAAPLPPHLQPHDTIGLLAANARGELAGACTTSGLAWKLPGRVGDSPLIGHGLYVDGDVGAACATGVGEEVIRICGSHAVVEMMRRGMSPQKACEEACRRIIDTNRRKRKRQDVPADAFLAVNKLGHYGACSVHQGYFKFAVTTGGYTRLIQAKGLLPPRKP